MSEQKKFVRPAVPVAALRPGFKAGYVIDVDGKEILTKGEVFGFRRVGQNRAEVTLLHEKTGAFFTNVLKANSPAVLLGIEFDPEADAVTKLLAERLGQKVQELASDFYTIMPIED